MFSAGRQSGLRGSAGSPGGLSPPLPKPTRHRQPGIQEPGRALAGAIHHSQKRKKKKRNRSRKQQRGFLRKRKGKGAVRWSLTWWHLPLGLGGGCGVSARVSRTGADTMETFRLVPCTHTNMLETARTEMSLFLADARRDFLFAAVFCICGFPYGNAVSL